MQYLASCSPDRTIRLWHTENFASSDHTHIRSNVEYDHATSLCVSQDGQCVSSCRTRSPPLKLSRSFSRFLSYCQSSALAASLESSKIRLFKVANKTMTHVIDIHEVSRQNGEERTAYLLWTGSHPPAFLVGTTRTTITSLDDCTTLPWPPRRRIATLSCATRTTP